MEKIALDGEDSASEVSAAGNSGSAFNIGKSEQVIPPDEEASHPRKSVLQFEPVRIVSSAGNALQHADRIFTLRAVLQRTRPEMSYPPFDELLRTQTADTDRTRGAKSPSGPLPWAGMV